MANAVELNAIYRRSEDIISKDIEGESILVPLISGVGNLNDEMFQLNSTGSVIWEMLDGRKSLIHIIEQLSNDYDSSYETIEKDVIRLIKKLIQRDFVSKAK